MKRKNRETGFGGGYIDDWGISPDSSVNEESNVSDYYDYIKDVNDYYLSRFQKSYIDGVKKAYIISKLDAGNYKVPESVEYKKMFADFELNRKLAKTESSDYQSNPSKKESTLDLVYANYALQIKKIEEADAKETVRAFSYFQNFEANKTAEFERQQARRDNLAAKSLAQQQKQQEKYINNEIRVYKNIFSELERNIDHFIHQREDYTDLVLREVAGERNRNIDVFSKGQTEMAASFVAFDDGFDTDNISQSEILSASKRLNVLKSKEDSRRVYAEQVLYGNDLNNLRQQEQYLSNINQSMQNANINDQQQLNILQQVYNQLVMLNKMAGE